MEVEFTNLEKVVEQEEVEVGDALEETVINISDNTDKPFDQEDSDISDAVLDSSSSVFKWLTKITGVDLRIRCDVFLEPPKVHLDITLSTGRHLCLDNLRQCSDDAIENTKNKTVMVRTYKGKDLLKIRCTQDSKSFSILEPQSDKPVSQLTVSHSKMEVHNLVQDQWYEVDLSNRRSKLILIRSENGILGRILGFGDLEPQSSSNGNVMILRPKLKFAGTDVQDTSEGLDNVQKAILLSIFIALGMTFDGDVRKTTDLFNLFTYIMLILAVIFFFVVYRNSESFQAHKNLILLIYCLAILFMLGFLYLVRCCLR